MNKNTKEVVLQGKYSIVFDCYNKNRGKKKRNSLTAAIDGISDRPGEP
jgi:hypothetical protein